MTPQEVVEKIDKREEKGKLLATSRTIYRIVNTDVFYVESETKDGLYYYVMYDTAKDFEWCSCLDNSTRRLKCKYIWGVEFAIKMATIKDTDKLPPASKKSKGYDEDEYSF